MIKAEQLFVWYSPKWDEIRLATKESGFMFKDGYGEKHLCYRLPPRAFEMADFYLIGEL